MKLLMVQVIQAFHIRKIGKYNIEKLPSVAEVLKENVMLLEDFEFFIHLDVFGF